MLSRYQVQEVTFNMSTGYSAQKKKSRLKQDEDNFNLGMVGRKNQVFCKEKLSNTFTPYIHTYVIFIKASDNLKTPGVSK